MPFSSTSYKLWMDCPCQSCNHPHIYLRNLSLSVLPPPLVEGVYHISQIVWPNQWKLSPVLYLKLKMLHSSYFSVWFNRERDINVSSKDFGDYILKFVYEIYIFQKLNRIQFYGSVESAFAFAFKNITKGGGDICCILSFFCHKKQPL